MATNGNSHVNVKQCLTQPGTMDGQQGIVQQPEALPHTVVQQGHDNADQINNVMCTQTNDVANQQGLEVNTQLPGVKNHGALPAEEDRQKTLDAAETLLILHNSPQA
ncbi:hypothetical protein ACRRTK_002368 [Alexandromys fortis]